MIYLEQNSHTLSYDRESLITSLLVFFIYSSRVSGWRKIFFCVWIGFRLQKNFFSCSGSGRVSVIKNFFRVGFGLKILLHAGLRSRLHYR